MVFVGIKRFRCIGYCRAVAKVCDGKFVLIARCCRVFEVDLRCFYVRVAFSIRKGTGLVPLFRYLMVVSRNILEIKNTRN